MRAVVIDGHGDLDVVRVAEVADPVPGPRDVVVRMRAAALNHLDLWTIAGLPGLRLRFPHVLGADGCGVVDSVGSEVSEIRPGAEVVINPGLSCGACELCRAGEQSQCAKFELFGEHRPGVFAERAVVPAANVFPVPAHLTAAEAAALGVTFITAYRMLFTRGRLRPGEWVAVTGAGGGLATSLIQLAATVAGRLWVTSSSDDKIERARSLGALGGVNYERDDPGRALRRMAGGRGLDLVVDSAGGAGLASVMRALRPGGRAVVAGATSGATAEIDVRRLFWRQLEIIGSTMGSVTDVSDMLRAVAGRGLRPVVAATFPLERARTALEHLRRRDRFGKIVLEIAD